MRKTVTCSTTVWKHQYLAHSSTFLYFVTCLYVDNDFFYFLFCALFILQSWKFKNFRNLYQNQYYQSIPGRIWYHITASSLCRYNSITKSGRLELVVFHRMSVEKCFDDWVSVLFWEYGRCYMHCTAIGLTLFHWFTGRVAHQKKQECTSKMQGRRL